MLPIEDALALMLDHTPTLAAEQVELGDALGRIIRQECIADIDQPPFHRARMDGYAVIADDARNATDAQPVRLREVGQAMAGSSFDGVVAAGQAVRIMTGAPVPAGADAVQKIEVIREGADAQGKWIELTEPIQAGQSITPRGAEACAGTVIVASGARITPAVAAVLASFGCARPLVARRPCVALLSTGSELVEIDQTPGPAQIRNSNTYSLAGYAQVAGAEVISRSIVRDDFDATRDAIARALTNADVVMLSGGVSMGDYDLVKPALVDLGAEVMVEKVAMHPGKPTVFARLGDKLIFGLPGNPVSVAVSFHIFARPALLKLQGASALHLPRLRVFAARDVKGAPPRRSHQPAQLVLRDGRAEAAPLKWAGSSDLVAFMQADALIVVPEDRASLSAGELIEVISLKG